MLLESQPLEVLPHAVVLSVVGERRELANDYMWIFAGGTPPTAFLDKIGVRAGLRDVRAEVETEAAALAR